MGRLLLDLSAIHSACVSIEALAIISLPDPELVAVTSNLPHSLLSTRRPLLDALEVFLEPQLLVRSIQIGSIWLDLLQLGSLLNGTTGLGALSWWSMRRVLRGGPDVLRRWGRLPSEFRAEKAEDQAREAEAVARQEEAEERAAAARRRRERIELGIEASENLGRRYREVEAFMTDASGAEQTEPAEVKTALDTVDRLAADA